MSFRILISGVQAFMLIMIAGLFGDLYINGFYDNLGPNYSGRMAMVNK